MVSIILTILYLCMPRNKGLGIAAIIFDSLGVLIDFYCYGWLCLIDLVMLIIVALVFMKNQEKF